MTGNRQKQVTTTRAERKKIGKSLRQQVPLESHSQWKPAADRPDPLVLLQAQDESRLEHLLPIKYGRMLVSPFTFYRGSAVLMAADLAGKPVSGIEVMLCGDAHLLNFGIFASPERRMVFDLNDFDEAFPGPWEWDLRRLAASAVIAGRDNGFSEQACRDLAVDVALEYTNAMNHFSQMRTLEQWYYHVNVDSLLKVFEQSSKNGKKSAAKMVKKAQTKTHEQTVEQLTTLEDDRCRIISDPPLLVPFREMGQTYPGRADLKASEDQVQYAWQQYLDSLPDERRYLLQRYQIIDIALRVGGIGSVGTRCLIVLLKGGAADDVLILQLKEAGPSALEPYLRQRNYSNQAERVVIAQQLMQATSDIFLGWHSSEDIGDDYYDYYWRQLKDMKGSADVASLDEASLRAYLVVCSLCLARAHGRTGDEIKIRGYLGRKDTFAKAIGDFSVVYADQAEQDYEALVKAVKKGRIAAETGV